MYAVSVFDLDTINNRIQYLTQQLELKEVYTNLNLSASYNKELKMKPNF